MLIFTLVTIIAIVIYLVFLDEGDEGGPLDLDGLAGAVVEGDDEVEEVGLAQVGGRLLLEVSAADAGGHAMEKIQHHIT